MVIFAKKTKEEKALIKIDKNIDLLIAKNKYLRDPKYYKNNYWSWASWDSWAATGKSGGCYCCSVGYYNATLYNKRKNTNRGGKKSWLRDVSPHLCSSCVSKIQVKLNDTFTRI